MISFHMTFFTIFINKVFFLGGEGFLVKEVIFVAFLVIIHWFWILCVKQLPSIVFQLNCVG